MGVLTTNISGAIRDKIEGKPPQKYMCLPYGFRLGLAPTSDDLVLYREDKPTATVLMGRAGRDRNGARWWLNPGWRDEVKALVVMLGMEEVETDKEVITW